MACGGILAPCQVCPVADRHQRRVGLVLATHGLTERQQRALTPPVVSVFPVDHFLGTLLFGGLGKASANR
ncbi:hypothetical protein AJ88_13500 [Mesorhizobium amorphae CCBAU 01583]|nr:hypothetical protein AJ88_13500 [Mesorhizobium amorphae CCBAU 01583]